VPELPEVEVAARRLTAAAAISTSGSSGTVT